jgi:hypothetical protein
MSRQCLFRRILEIDRRPYADSRVGRAGREMSDMSPLLELDLLCVGR